MSKEALQLLLGYLLLVNLGGCACFTTRRSTGTSGTACPPFWRSRSSWGFFWEGSFHFNKSTN